MRFQPRTILLCIRCLRVEVIGGKYSIWPIRFDSHHFSLSHVSLEEKDPEFSSRCLIHFKFKFVGKFWSECACNDSFTFPLGVYLVHWRCIIPQLVDIGKSALPQILTQSNCFLLLLQPWGLFVRDLQPSGREGNRLSTKEEARWAKYASMYPVTRYGGLMVLNSKSRCSPENAETYLPTFNIWLSVW